MCFFDIKLQLGNESLSVNLCSCGICRHGDKRGPASFQLERGESSGSIHSVHDGETDMGKLGQPAFLVVVNMISDGLVHSFVGAFTASVGLRVV